MMTKPKTILHQFTVQATDFPHFNGKLIHQVCSTYKLTQEAEWAGRKVLLPLLTDATEGVGTFVELKHYNPAFEGETVTIKATPLSWDGKELIVFFKAYIGKRTIAIGKTGQAILPKTKLEQLFTAPISIQ